MMRTFIEYSFSWILLKSIDRQTILMHASFLCLYSKVGKQIFILPSSFFQLDTDTFQDLTELAELNLGQNYIMDIAEGLFIQNAKMEKLILYSNSLIEMREKSLMGLDNLLSLLINNNLLENIHHDCFLYAPNIQKL